jgi:hypothetical protein
MSRKAGAIETFLLFFTIFFGLYSKNVYSNTDFFVINE